MASLFDVFGRLLLEGDRAFVAEAAAVGKRAGDAAGKSMGGSMSSTLRATAGAGFKVLASGAALALGVATKGALQLEDATARYRAETGATAEEAERAARTINRVSGEQRQSLEAVTDAAIRVKRDLGAVGEEADSLTRQFVQFARVTRQDAAGAVEAFDDILDSWGLEAKDAQGLMDRMIVSQQRFGGSIVDNQRTLAGLAPALRAANFEIEDGIALLGLFGSKGLDANQGAAAFAKALTKVKSPEELQRLIADIANTEDAFERGQKAADLFGARAGAKLANALGGANLEDYVVSLEDAAGATDRAGEALDSTFSAQLKKRISEAGAAVRQFGADFGPAVTGAASLASLGAALGLDKLLGGAWSKAGSSTLVKRAVTAASGKAATLYLTGLIAGDRLGSALSGVWSKLPLGPVAAAGSKAGLAFSAAMTAAIVAAPVVITYVMVQQNNQESQKRADEISEAVRKVVGEGSIEGMKRALADLRQAMKIEEGQQTGLGGFVNRLFGASDERGQIQRDIDHLTYAIEHATGELPRRVGDILAEGQATVTAGASAMVEGVPGAVAAGAIGAGKAAEQTPQAIADGIRAKRNVVDQAMAALTDALANAMSPAKERAKLIGQLTGDEMAKGLRSKDPMVRAQAEATRDVLINRLEQLVPANGKLGKKASETLAKALKSRDPNIRAAANHVKEIVAKKLDATKGRASTAGTGAGNAFVSQLKRVVSGAVVTAQFRVSGVNSIGGKAVGGPVAAGTPYWVGERGKEIFVPEVDGQVLTHAESMAASSSGAAAVPAAAAAQVSEDLHLHVQGALPVRTFRDLILEQRRIRELRQSPPRELSPRYPRRLAGGIA